MITSQKQFDKAVKNAERLIKVINGNDLSKYLGGLPLMIANKELQLSGAYTCEMDGIKTMFYV